jgi:predicted O-methyltransferase YrrM
MLRASDRAEIDRLWARKLAQDSAGLPQSQRHRNLEPPSAEFLHALAAGIGARRIIEVGGSSGLSTIALAAAARETGGSLVSVEIEPQRQAEARETMARLGLSSLVEFVLADAAEMLPRHTGLDLALIDCEKEDYIRFFDLLQMRPGGIVVADNIISHSLSDYVAHVKRQAGAESITLAIGKGLEVTRVQTTAGA